MPLDKIRLPLAQITPGMKLAEPITNASGITLMPAGIRLTPMFISRIKKWNIEAIDVLIEKRGDPESRALPGAGGGTRVLRPAAALVRGKTRVIPSGNTLTAEQEEFARTVVKEISPPFSNLRDNDTMMQLRAAVIKKLIQEGRKSIVNKLRQLPQDPPPAGEKTEDADGA